jgi:hypothetical protein
VKQFINMFDGDLTVATYSLILFATPNTAYTAGWLAGSIPAHLIASELNRGEGDDGVFWECPVQFGRGVRESDRAAFKELMNEILDGKIEVDMPYKGIKLSRYGYFYDGSLSRVAWRFNLKRVFRGNHFNEDPSEKERFSKCFSFRDVYLNFNEKKNKGRCWFLISNIQRIEEPSPTISEGGGKYRLDGFKYADRSLLTSDFRYGGAVFTSQVPENCNNVRQVSAIGEIDTYLKQFFLTKLPEQNLRERVIQQAFAISLMQERKNWTLAMEQQLDGRSKDRRRTDIIFKDENGDMVAVEIKRANNDDPVSQLKEYIDKLEKKYEKRPKGIVIVGRADDELKARAKKEGFELLEYHVALKFDEVK